VTDIDISTDAVPDEVMRLVEAAGLKPCPPASSMERSLWSRAATAYEVTTFRRDVETDGRRAVVAFSSPTSATTRGGATSPSTRSMPTGGPGHRPAGEGLPDLAAGRIRFIEDAEARIREDYLRILRFFRFHAWYGHPEDGMDADALAAIAANSAG
jgi:poly(A) polymerase